MDIQWHFRLKHPFSENIWYALVFINSIAVSEFSGVYRILIWMNIIASKGCRKL